MVLWTVTRSRDQVETTEGDQSFNKVCSEVMCLISFCFLHNRMEIQGTTATKREVPMSAAEQKWSHCEGNSTEFIQCYEAIKQDDFKEVNIIHEWGFWPGVCKWHPPMRRWKTAYLLPNVCIEMGYVTKGYKRVLIWKNEQGARIVPTLLLTPVVHGKWKKEQPSNEELVSVTCNSV